MPFLSSSAFANGGPIPKKHTRLGEKIAPALSWSGAPDNVKSFAIVIEDPDAPYGTFRHWGVYNIAPTSNGLQESSDTANGSGLRFSDNNFGNRRYDGPEPPRGHGVHHYHFTVAALDVPNLTVPASAGIEAMWEEAQNHMLAKSSLMGTFQQS